MNRGLKRGETVVITEDRIAEAFPSTVKENLTGKKGKIALFSLAGESLMLELHDDKRRVWVSIGEVSRA